MTDESPETYRWFLSAENCSVIDGENVSKVKAIDCLGIGKLRFSPIRISWYVTETNHLLMDWTRTSVSLSDHLGIRTAVNGRTGAGIYQGAGDGVPIFYSEILLKSQHGTHSNLPVDFNSRVKISIRKTYFLKKWQTFNNFIYVSIISLCLLDLILWRYCNNMFNNFGRRR